MKRQSSYLEPFNWWGPVWTPPVSRSMDELISGGTLSGELASLLTTLVGRRASIVVAAGPSGAGKTTVLTALFDHLPPETTRVYLRGCYEPFDFLKQTDPATSALLVNEISPHLPIYLWGPGVHQTLEAVSKGYQLAATAHAESVEDFVYGLTSYPLRIPTDLLKSIDLLVLLGIEWRAGEPIRHVQEVFSLSTPSPPGTLQPERIAWNEDGSPLISIDHTAATNLLERLAGRHISSLPVP